jgi:hypothetical protein
MNDWNPLENQLRSWTPRRPSARLKARLFPSADTPETIPTRPARWAWFAPVTALFLLLSLVVGERTTGPMYVGHSGPDSVLAALALSNQRVASMLTSADSYDRNSPPRLAFSWTNSSRPTSSLNTTLLFTNSPIH